MCFDGHVRHLFNCCPENLCPLILESLGKFSKFCYNWTGGEGGGGGVGTLCHVTYMVQI